ncbi:hypothetical protein CLOP_g21209 [Closterium sp. NIES-67]|nr:hypothetical protein CLOP_g21209 [Closterium sp. NIES-67]
MRGTPPSRETTEVETDEEKTSEPPGKIKELLKEFQDILPNDLPDELPPYRTHQHEIVEEPRSKPTFRAPYRLSPTELADMKKQIEYLLAKGLIGPSTSPYGAPVLFTPKPDGSMRIHGIFKIRSAVRILADKDGGRFRSQNSLPNSVRIVRVSGNAVRTHQRTGNVPSRNESYPTPTLGRMRGGVPGRHPRLLAQYAATRRTLTTRLCNSSTRTVLRQTIQERLRPRESPIPLTYCKRSRSSRRPQENRSRAYVEDTREYEGVTAVPWLR